jgi:hypothetical protein
VAIEATLEVGFAGIGLQHSAALAAIGELTANLRTVPDLRARERAGAGDGMKGVPPELFVSLGTSGAVAGLVRIVRLWLNRDQRRSLIVRIQTGGEDKVISVEGDQISVDAINKALEVATRQDPPPGNQP